PDRPPLSLAMPCSSTSTPRVTRNSSLPRSFWVFGFIGIPCLVEGGDAACRWRSIVLRAMAPLVAELLGFGRGQHLGMVHPARARQQWVDQHRGEDHHHAEVERRLELMLLA